MYCKQCGTENVDDAVFCRECGARIERPYTSDDTPQPAFTKLPNEKRLNTTPILGAIIVIIALVAIMVGFLTNRSTQHSDAGEHDQVVEGATSNQFADPFESDMEENGFNVEPAINEGSDTKNYADAYVDSIRDKTDEYPTLHFGLCYIDSDSIPELVIFTNAPHTAPSVIIEAWVNGSIKKVNEFYSNYSSITYAEYDGLVCLSSGFTGSWWDEYYEISNATATTVKTFSGMHDPETYEVDGTRCSLEDYNQAYSDFCSGHNWLYAGFELGFEPNDSLLDSLSSNPATFVIGEYGGRDGY